MTNNARAYRRGSTVVAFVVSTLFVWVLDRDQPWIAVACGAVMAAIQYATAPSIREAAQERLLRRAQKSDR